MDSDSVDQQLFAGTAYYYSRYRDRYAEELPSALASMCHLDGTGRLLDLGTGSGVLAVLLARSFTHVVAVDPDPEMLSEAARSAMSRDVRNISFIQQRAEEMKNVREEYRLITIGSAFHWMDRTRITRFSYDALENNGVFALIGGSREQVSSSTLRGVPIPKKQIQSIIRRYLGARRRAGNDVYEEPDEKYEDLLDRSAFGHHKRFSLPGKEVSRNIDEIVGALYSTSFASRRLFGEDLNEFEKELRSMLINVSPSGIFSTISGATEVIYASK